MDLSEIEALRGQLSVRVGAALDLPRALDDDRPLDKYRLQADPTILRDLAILIGEQLPPDTEVLVGVEVGGIGIAAALALHTGLPWSIARRTRGEVTISGIVGTPVDGRRTVLIKDAAMGGGSLPPLAESLRDHGALVLAIAVGLTWNPDLADVIESAGFSPAIALTLADLRAAW